LFAQAPHWNALPTVYVHDAVGKTIRPLVGVIGSSYPGQVLLDSVDWASFALNHRSALVYRAGILAWVPDLSTSNLSDGFASYTLLNVPLPQQVIWAADSTRAVVLAAGSPRLVWLGQFDASPRVVASWDLDSSQTDWALLAADSSANQALLASQSGDSSQLWLVSQTKAPIKIAGFNRPVAAVIASGGSSAFVADAVSHQILLVRSLNASPAVAPFVASEQYVADPIGLAMSSDGTNLFLADGSGKVIRVFQAGTGALGSELPLQAAPLSLTPVSTSSFLLDGRTQKEQAFFFLDTRAGGRVFFVPAGQ
jgi:DNA-binding beta-propeller fold protein YncE